MVDEEGKGDGKEEGRVCWHAGRQLGECMNKDDAAEEEGEEGEGEDEGFDGSVKCGGRG